MEQPNRQFGDFLIDRAHNTVTSGAHSQQVPPRVMDVLLYLIDHRDRVVSTDELLAAFWGDRIVEESTIHRIVSQIRRVLGDSARQQKYIRTVSKRGYQAIASVSKAAPATATTAPVRPPAPAQPPAPVQPSPAVAPERPQRFRYRWVLPGAGALALIIAAAVLIALVAPKDGTRVPSPSGPDPTTAQEGRMTELRGVAMLPIINLSNDPSLDYFATGLVEGVLDELVKQDLQVAARTSTFNAAGDGVDLAAIARQLNVDYVIEGSIQKDGEAIRVTTQLIRAEDGFHVWSKTYDETLSQGFDTQSLIASNVARIVSTLIEADRMLQHPERFDELRGVNPRAVEYYVEGQRLYSLFALGEGGDWDYAVQLHRNAAAADPDFAAAHLQIAWASMQRLNGRLSIRDASSSAHAAIARALAIEPESSNALLQLAQIQIDLDLDYASAEDTIARGLELNPRGRWWYPLLAGIAIREGREADAMRLIDSASVFDFGEEQVTYLTLVAFHRISSRNEQAALEATERALRLAAGGPTRAAALRWQAFALTRLGRLDEARARIKEAWLIGGAREPESFAALFARTGEAERARALLSQAQFQPRNAFDVALGYAALGDSDNAFAWLEQGIQEHEPKIISTLRTGSYWDELRADSRFMMLINLLSSKETRTTRFDLELE